MLANWRAWSMGLRPGHRPTMAEVMMLDFEHGSQAEWREAIVAAAVQIVRRHRG